VKPETRDCTRNQSKEKSPSPFSTTTVGLPFPVQFTCSRWPPRSTSFPSGFVSEAFAAKSEQAPRMIAQERFISLDTLGIARDQIISGNSFHTFSQLRRNFT